MRLAIERRDEGGALPRERTMATDFVRWLAPTGMFATAFGMALYALNRLVMRGLFRLRVTGAEQLPAAGVFVVPPHPVRALGAVAAAAAPPHTPVPRPSLSGGVLRCSSPPPPYPFFPPPA